MTLFLAAVIAIVAFLGIPPVHVLSLAVVSWTCLICALLIIVVHLRLFARP